MPVGFNRNLPSLALRLPGRCAFLPPVVRERLMPRTVGFHDEQLAVRLGDISTRRSVLAAEPRAPEEDEFAVRRPCRMGVVAGRRRQLSQAGAIWSDRVDVELVLSQTAEDDAITVGRPEREIVVARRQ